MRVQVKMKRGGAVKNVPEREANLLVRIGRAEYYHEPEVAKKVYKTKVMKADVEDGEPKKRAGRPKKVSGNSQGVSPPVTDNSYDTKVMTSEE